MAETRPKIVPKPGGPLVTNIRYCPSPNGMGVEVGGLAKLKLLEFSHILVLYFALSEVAVCIPIKYLGNLMKQKQEDAETEMKHLSLILICWLSITVSKGVTRETIIQILTTFGIKFIFCSTIMS